MWLVLCFTACCAEDFVPGEKVWTKQQEKPMTKQYNMIFADSRRSSYMSIKSISSGQVEWEADLSKNEAASSPKAVLVSEEFLVVYSGTHIAAYTNQGKRLWTKDIIFGSPVSIAEGKVFFREKTAPIDELSAVLLDGTPVDATMIILDSYASGLPVYIEPLADTFIAMCAITGGVEDGSPEVVFYRKAYNSEDYIWVSEFVGQAPISPLHIRETNRFVVFTARDILVYNSSPPEREQELYRYPHPVPQLLEASASQDDILYILGTEEDKVSLAALAVDGEELWRYSGIPYHGYTTYLKPPILGPDSSVHVVAGFHLTTIKDGQLVRRFSTEKGEISFGTALADGSILLVAGMTLLQVDSEGKVILEVSFEEVLLTPPVVDQEGKIYVASAQKLYKIS